MGRAWTAQDDISHAGTRRIESIETLSNPIGNSQIEIVQLGRGRISGEILHGQVKNVAFSRGVFSLPIRATGVFSADKVVVASLLHCTGPSRSLGETVASGDVLIYPPGSEHDRIYEGAAAFTGVSCEAADLLGFFADDEEISKTEFWAKRRHFRFGKGAHCTPGPLLTAVAARLNEARCLSSAAADYWKRAVMEAFLAPVALHPAAGAECAVPSSIKIVREAERYIEDNSDRPIHVSEICSRIKVGRRSLYRAFDDAVGRGPIDFLRVKRLSMVHLRLREADPERGSVADVAAELGFLELGRFAQQYRSLFGEYPRQTLQRNSRKNVTVPFGSEAPSGSAPAKKVQQRSRLARIA